MRQRKQRSPNLTALIIEKVRTRLRAGDSWAQVQAHFGISRSTIGRIVQGKVKGRRHRENPIRHFKLVLPPSPRLVPVPQNTGRSYEMFPRRTA